MMWLYLLIGALAAGPLWLLFARLRLRRSIYHTRRVAAATRQQEHLVELGTLTGGLAHELKNPLSTIKVNLQLLMEDLSAPGANEQHARWLRRLQSVAGEVTRLQDVLDDFLRFAGKHELQWTSADLRGIVSDLSDFFTPQAEAAHVRVRVFMPEEPIMAQVDVDLFKQALLNLMLNAQQAMPAGGELIIKVTRSSRNASIEVIDTGTGMPQDVAENIFHAYYTTKRGGTGLGLPTALRIVREHGGQITVDTAPDKGTRFLITLPLDAGKAPSAIQ